MKTPDNKEEITVPKEWFERLFNMLKALDECKESERLTRTHIILGYISSIEAILKYNVKK